MKSKANNYKWIIVILIIFLGALANAQNATNLKRSETLNFSSEESYKNYKIPSFFDNGDRIYLSLKAINGKAIEAFTDTGGGWSILYPWTIKRLGLKDALKLDSITGNNYILAKNVFEETHYQPFISLKDRTHFNEPYFSVPSDELLSRFGDKFKNEEAFFGQFFFINHAWKFDYINKEVLILNSPNLNLEDSNTQKLGFKKDSTGQKLFGHPSMIIKIDGKDIPMLFDTGATFHLSEEAQSKLNLKAEIGGSFIAQSIYEEWKINHREWQIIKAGDEVPNGNMVFKMDMIKVPEIEIGSITVGPVWFSVRPDQAWSQGMIRTMDKVVKGAIGGSVLKYLSVTIDYPNELIHFKQ